MRSRINGKRRCWNSGCGGAGSASAPLGDLPSSGAVWWRKVGKRGNGFGQGHPLGRRAGWEGVGTKPECALKSTDGLLPLYQGFPPAAGGLEAADRACVLGATASLVHSASGRCGLCWERSGSQPHRGGAGWNSAGAGSASATPVSRIPACGGWTGGSGSGWCSGCNGLATALGQRQVRVMLGEERFATPPRGSWLEQCRRRQRFRSHQLRRCEKIALRPPAGKPQAFRTSGGAAATASDGDFFTPAQHLGAMDPEA